MKFIAAHDFFLIFFGVSLSAADLCACAGSGSEQPDPKTQMETIERESQPEKLVRMGIDYAQIGDTTRAEQYFGEAMMRGAPRDKVTPLVVKVCVQDGRFRLAIKYAEEFLAERPENVGMRNVLGSLYLAVDEYDEADKTYAQVLQRSPQNPEAIYAVALIAKNRRDGKRSDEYFRKYLQIAPNGKHAEEARAGLLREVPQSASSDLVSSQNVSKAKWPLMTLEELAPSDAEEHFSGDGHDDPARGKTRRRDDQAPDGSSASPEKWGSKGKKDQEKSRNTPEIGQKANEKNGAKRVNNEKMGLTKRNPEGSSEKTEVKRKRGDDREQEGVEP